MSDIRTPIDAHYHFNPFTGEVSGDHPTDVYFRTSITDIAILRELCRVRQLGFEQGLAYPRD